MTASSFSYSIVCVANGNKTKIAYVIDTINIVNKEWILGLGRYVL